MTPLISIGGRGQQEGYQRANDLLSLPVNRRPDGVLVSSHLMTIGAMQAIREKGLGIPRDLAVIGFDDTPWAPLLNPPLSVVHQQAYEMGSQGARLLQMRLDGEARPFVPQRIVLPTALVHRKSCCLSGGDE